MRFVILADDFTGAMDTGIQFAQRGIVTAYYEDISLFHKALSENACQVFVVNTKSRHLSAAEAYVAVSAFSAISINGGVDGIMKKTDSGLRGNVAGELESLVAADPNAILNFIPAYPKMNRITRGGCQYIDGIPVHESVFGKDPFDPVLTSCVRDLFADGERITIWDASSEEDIRRIVKSVAWPAAKSASVPLWAGCAGLGEVLAEQLPFQFRELEPVTYPSELLVICGSVNEVTGKQVFSAGQNGFFRESLGAEKVFDHAYWECGDGQRWLEQIWLRCSEGIPCVVDTGFPDKDEIVRSSQRQHITVAESSRRTAAVLGGILCHMTRRQIPAVLMIIGGDTLQAYMEQLEFRELHLLRQLIPGVVLCRVIWEKGEQILITKSGGFGDEDLLIKLWEMLQNRK